MDSEKREHTLKQLMLTSMEGDATAYKDFLTGVSMTARGYLAKRVAFLGSQGIEDLVQEILLTIHLKKDSFRTDLRILPWVYTIIRHKMIDELRSDKRHTKYLKSLETTFTESEDADDLESREEVECLLAGLPEKQKEMLIMAKVEQKPLQEIATEMNVSLSSVKVSIHRALGSLRGKHSKKDGP